VGFVGRTAELERLGHEWRRVRDQNRCELVTVLGEAGVGKSRLTAEFLAGVEAQIVRGRCLPYGEGITYWPVIEVIKQLDRLPSEPDAAASLRSLLGETEQTTSAEEIAWAFRKLLEESAPLVCVFDDIQWGEEIFLDLVEAIAVLSSDAPIMLLCLARPQLVERRPQWPAPLRLDPLPEQDIHVLIGDLPDDLREKIARASGGNPLFVTEMAAMARETEGDVVVPATLKALLAARLDQLDVSERSVLERGAVEGETFHRGAVQALSDNGHVTPPLTALVRKELIRPDKPRLQGEDGFRFRHLLIRDAAYDALPKAARGKLHERFADWLEEHGTELVELDEILGYHLEQAARYVEELGRPDAALAERAGGRLAAAGRRALWRGDYDAAVTLLDRAVALQFEVAPALDLAVVHFYRLDPDRAIAIAEEAAQHATASEDPTGEAAARVVAAHYRSQVATKPAFDELESLADAALPLLEQAEDHVGLVHVWMAIAELGNVRGQLEARTHAIDQAIHHARLAGYKTTHLFGLDVALTRGPRPADEALTTLDALLPEPLHPDLLLSRAVLLAMLNRIGEAWPLARAASQRRLELTGNERSDLALAEIGILSGDDETAARLLRRQCDLFEERGFRAYLSTYAPKLGRSLCSLGRYDEAEPLARLGREFGDEQDVATQMLWRQVQARVHASRSEYAKAEHLAREAVEITERTDLLNWQGDALCDLAEVLAAAGRIEEAAQALEQALERYERKNNLAMVAQVRPRLEEVRSHTA
jgi:tetratricopeptide (TPR) repeat protein